MNETGQPGLVGENNYLDREGSNAVNATNNINGQFCPLCALEEDN